MAAALGRGGSIPQLHEDAWGEGGGHITELRVHLLLCHPIHPAGLSCQGRGTAESQERTGQAVTDLVPNGALDTTASPWLPNSWFGISARNDPEQGIAMLPLTLVMLLGCPEDIVKATVTGHCLPNVHH